MESWPRKHRITVDEYYRMAEVGLLAPDARVELIDGEIIDMAPLGTRHCTAVDILTRLFVTAAGERAIVRIQGPILLAPDCMPQPDIALLAPSEDQYGHAHPGPADILLLVEVSDTTLHYDLDVKVPLYARRGIRETWIVDLKGKVLRWYRSPRDGAYADHGVVSKSGVISPGALPDIAVELAAVLPR